MTWDPESETRLGLVGPREGLGKRRAPMPPNPDENYTTTGSKRCCKIESDGTGRCKSMAVLPTDFCKHHGGLMIRAQGFVTRNYGALLQGQGIREAFAQFAADPDICDVRAELALQRTLLASVLTQLGEGPVELGKITLDQIAAITHLNDSVARLADVATKIESKSPTSISMAQVSWVISQLTDVLLDALEAELDGPVGISQRQRDDDSSDVRDDGTRDPQVVRRRIAIRVADAMEAIVVPGARHLPKAPIDAAV